jgi:GDP-L-fucose synthase
MKKVLVTGGHGMVGSELREIRPDFLFPKKSELDLLSLDSVKNFFGERRGEICSVIHLAAKVGGVKANSDFVADFFYQNSVMNQNLLQTCSDEKIEKVVSMLSTCVYPDEKFVRYPLTEDQLHVGPPHHSNFGYAFAKRMLDVQSRAYRKQYGCNFVTAIPNNMYGLNDNYDLESSHVIPALIRKFYEAKLHNIESVTVWGTGSPKREFTFARDAAQIALWLLENYDGENPVNIGNTGSITIKELVSIISEEVGFNGNLVFDASKPDGQFEKPSSNERLMSLGWDGKYTNLRSGIRETVEHFSRCYPHVRGI